MKSVPIIKDYRQPRRKLSKSLLSVVTDINVMIDDGEFQLVDSHCMCGNNHENEDFLITNRDCWGLHIGQVLCSKCGLIRNRYVFSAESNRIFYEKYYRKLYNPNINMYERYFDMQRKRGEEFYSLLNNLSIIDDINNIAEFGCGAGGVLLPFTCDKKNVIGIDLDDNFLKIGKANGLRLMVGDFYDLIENESCDLVIMSHVKEHLLNPIDEVIKVSTKIRKGKYLLVQVPGLFSNPKPNYPSSGFQIAHLYYFYKEWLMVFFNKLGLKILYCDDKCTFVLKKTSSLTPIDRVWDESLRDYPSIVFNRCKKSALSNGSILKERFSDLLFQVYLFLKRK